MDDLTTHHTEIQYTASTIFTLPKENYSYTTDAECPNQGSKDVHDLLMMQSHKHTHTHTHTNKHTHTQVDVDARGKFNYIHTGTSCSAKNKHKCTPSSMIPHVNKQSKTGAGSSVYMHVCVRACVCAWMCIL